MTGQHPQWCDVENLCTAGPVADVPFSDGEHRSPSIPLPVEPVVWAMRPGVMTAYLTKRPCAAWECATYLHIESERHGLLAQMPVTGYSRLAGLLGQLVGLAEQTQPDQSPAPALHLGWPQGYTDGPGSAR